MSDGQQLALSIDSIRSNAEDALSSFLKNNPDASIDVEDVNAYGNCAYVLMPWDDESLAIRVQNEDKKIVEILNGILLPPRLSAIYHIAEKRLEIIWTAFVLPESAKKLEGRTFTVTFKENEHYCEFTDASEVLQQLASRCQLVSSPVSTNFRNLASFIYANRDDTIKSVVAKSSRPLSFTISNVSWNEEHVIDLIRHLNFYMRYYDMNSPVILVHSKRQENNTGLRRYIMGEFPPKFDMVELEENMLNYWNGSINAGPSQTVQFLHYFRIMEYASHNVLSDVVRENVRKQLMAPTFSGYSDYHIELIAETLVGNPLEDYEKFEATIRRHVHTDALWEIIEQHRKTLSKRMEFDGGFFLEPLLQGNQNKESSDAILDVFVKRIKNIRNVLSHGRDRGSKGVFHQTVKNLDMLRPWVEMMSLIAGDILIHRRPFT